MDKFNIFTSLLGLHDYDIIDYDIIVDYSPKIVIAINNYDYHNLH